MERPARSQRVSQLQPISFHQQLVLKWLCGEKSPGIHSQFCSSLWSLPALTLGSAAPPSPQVPIPSQGTAPHRAAPELGSGPGRPSRAWFCLRVLRGRALHGPHSSFPLTIPPSLHARSMELFQDTFQGNAGARAQPPPANCCEPCGWEQAPAPPPRHICTSEQPERAPGSGHGPWSHRALPRGEILPSHCTTSAAPAKSSATATRTRTWAGHQHPTNPSQTLPKAPPGVQLCLQDPQPLPSIPSSPGSCPAAACCSQPAAGTGASPSPKASG